MPFPKRPVATVAPATTAPATGCTPDYCVPASWDTATAPTRLPQIAPFSEPINVVIGARSTVSLGAIQRALGNWETVSTATTVSVAGVHIGCISSEKADVAGDGYVTEQAAWRLDGCLHGNELSLSGEEGHVRLWHQGGYDDGAADFADAVINAAGDKGWHVGQQFVTVPRAAHAGEGGVTFSDEVDVLTITSAG